MEEEKTEQMRTEPQTPGLQQEFQQTAPPKRQTSVGLDQRQATPWVPS